jgi:hypothetical protein
MELESQVHPPIENIIPKDLEVLQGFMREVIHFKIIGNVEPPSGEAIYGGCSIVHNIKDI